MSARLLYDAELDRLVCTCGASGSVLLVGPATDDDRDPTDLYRCARCGTSGRSAV